MMRPSKDVYYMGIAKAVAQRGTCLRRCYGAVIVNNDQIISTGYCGAPRGVQNCIDIKKCKREELKIPSGERYELCMSVHAEMNAIIHATRERMIGSILYVYGQDTKSNKPVAAKPCMLCKKMIINAGISKVMINTVKGMKTFDVNGWLDDPLV